MDNLEYVKNVTGFYTKSNFKEKYHKLDFTIRSTVKEKLLLILDDIDNLSRDDLIEFISINNAILVIHKNVIVNTVFEKVNPELFANSLLYSMLIGLYPEEVHSYVSSNYKSDRIKELQQYEPKMSLVSYYMALMKTQDGIWESEILDTITHEQSDTINQILRDILQQCYIGNNVIWLGLFIEQAYKHNFFDKFDLDVTLFEDIILYASKFNNYKFGVKKSSVVYIDTIQKAIIEGDDILILMERLGMRELLEIHNFANICKLPYNYLKLAISHYKNKKEIIYPLFGILFLTKKVMEARKLFKPYLDDSELLSAIVGKYNEQKVIDSIGEEKSKEILDNYQEVANLLSNIYIDMAKLGQISFNFHTKFSSKDKFPKSKDIVNTSLDIVLLNNNNTILDDDEFYSRVNKLINYSKIIR